MLLNTESKYANMCAARVPLYARRACHYVRGACHYVRWLRVCRPACSSTVAEKATKPRMVSS